MDNYIGKYQGVDIWAINFEDFVALDPIAQVTRDKIYLILDDRRVIKTGMVFGYVTRDNKRLNPSPKSIHWTVASCPLSDYELFNDQHLWKLAICLGLTE